MWREGWESTAYAAHLFSNACSPLVATSPGPAMSVAPPRGSAGSTVVAGWMLRLQRPQGQPCLLPHLGAVRAALLSLVGCLGCNVPRPAASVAPPRGSAGSTVVVGWVLKLLRGLGASKKLLRGRARNSDAFSPDDLHAGIRSKMQ